MINPSRVCLLSDRPIVPGPVVYWMQRDQRARDNWALLHAQELAAQMKQPLVVAFCLVDDFTNANLRHYDFMLRGLAETAAAIEKRQIPFVLLQGLPGEQLPRLMQHLRGGALVTDFLPMRIKTTWLQEVGDAIEVSFHEVDAHNIVPAWTVSDKQETAARTLRPKINRMLTEFLTEFPPLARQPAARLSAVAPLLEQASRDGWLARGNAINWAGLLGSLRTDRSVTPVDWLAPGPAAATKMLRRFLRSRLDRYAQDRNDPTVNGQSGLSPYLHFGQLSGQRVALEVRQAAASEESRAAFLEELIVRRELSDNYCLYNNSYDSLDGAPQWGRRTLHRHRRDRRVYVYGLEELERASTHDSLWNAAQRDMVRRGKMHGYLRMYWAKKILEWTPSPQEALACAVYLNDKYFLDGRDPNGYANLVWSIGGLHDTPFPERPIFGNTRYMSYDGCARKFDVQAYIDGVE